MAIAAAIVANLIVLTVARVASGEFPMATVGDDDQTIGVAQVIAVTLLVGLAAGGVLALLERTTSRARAIWTVIGVIVLVLSLFGPLGSGVNTSSKVALTCMHLAAAATIIPLMRRSAAAPLR